MDGIYPVSRSLQIYGLKYRLLIQPSLWLSKLVASVYLKFTRDCRFAAIIKIGHTLRVCAVETFQQQ